MAISRTSRLFVDMDGTLARFHDEVHYLERMFEENFFHDLAPFYEMVDGLKVFMQQHPDVEVFVLSSKVDGEPPYCEKEKNEWLDKYLPEIDKAHRFFPRVGTPKASVVPGGVTKNDYLLDDYNRGLEAFVLAGGNAIKCHNNINQMGLGRHGGDSGKRWTGKMVHTNDFPDMISAELAKHMGLPYDLDRAAGAYGIEIERNSADVPYALHRLSENNDGSYSARGINDTVVNFRNPLNAIRACSAYSWIGFEEIRTSCGLCLTKNQVLDLAFNAGIRDTPALEAPSEKWDDLAMKLQIEAGMVQETEPSGTVSRHRRQEIIENWNNETNDPETQEWRDDLTSVEKQFVAKLDDKYSGGVERIASDALVAEARKMAANAEKQPAEDAELGE